MVCQFDSRVARTIRSIDPAAIIPQWTFFAPIPAVTDYHVLYRDRYTDTTYSEWMEVVLDTRRCYRSLWNADKRRAKAVFDMIQSMAATVGDSSADEIKLSVPYILFLQLISKLPRTRPPELTQFLIVESYGHLTDEPPRTLFRSEFHRI
jgi:hypothetical protein